MTFQKGKMGLSKLEEGQEEIFNVIHILRTFCMQHIIKLEHLSYVPFLEQQLSQEHPKSSTVS